MEEVPYPHVWAVANKVSVMLFKTEKDADKYIYSFPPSVAGGMSKTLMPVFEAAQ